jgi:hypothetical protein
MKTNELKEIFAKYLALWTAHYSKTEFGGTSVQAAGEYAALDCMNVGKRSNWTAAEYWDDISYWEGKLAK